VNKINKRFKLSQIKTNIDAIFCINAVFFKILKTVFMLIHFSTFFFFQKYERKHDSFIFQYGPQLGTAIYREKLAEFLTDKYKSKVDPRDLILNAGATNGFLLLLSTLMDYNGVVFVDDVTYMIALTSLADFETLKIVPVKLNENGVDLIDLEEKVKKFKFEPREKLFFGCYYTIPAYHNPTGICFSESKQKIVFSSSEHFD
jgi:DNA-binding transcriptional MocR family regulator